MNRLLTEGRRAFLQRVSGIQRGAECARYEPLLSALADGEASAEELAVLRRHMQTCLSCRAALREFRSMPDRVASVLPQAALAADGGGPLRSLMESVVGAAQHKAAAMGDRLQTAAELATGQKVAAVAASAAALAGGGTAIDQFANHQGVSRTAQVREQHHGRGAEQPQTTEALTDPSPQPPPSGPAPPTNPEPAAEPAPQPEPVTPPPDPAAEFTPTGAAQQSSAAPPPTPPPQEGSTRLAGGAGGGRSTTAGTGEFAP